MTNLTIALACRQLIQDRQGRRVLRGVDLDLPVGTITVLLGANGAGKSTLLMTFAGQLPYKRGAIRIGDMMLAERPAQSLKQLMYVPQRPPLEPSLSLREHADAMMHLRGLQTSEATQNLIQHAAQMGLSNAIDRPIAALSGGMQQKCALCLGLLAETPVLLLDEPYAGLDIPSATALRDLLRQRKAQELTTLIASHSAEATLDLADRAIVLNRGRISALLDSTDLQALQGDPRALERRILDAMGSGDVAGQPVEGT